MKAAVLLGVLLAICIAHFALHPSFASSSWTMATIAAAFGLFVALVLVIDGRR